MPSDATGAGADRECGSCSLCCTVLRVDPLRKLGGVDCVHQQRDGSGCGIHGRADRPALCGAYRCAWLRGHFEPEDRPDRLGAVLDFAQDGVMPLLAIREERPGAFERSERLRQIGERMRTSMSVRITSADDVMDADRPYRILLAGGDEQRIEGEHVERWRDGQCVERSRMPAIERSVRRLSLWWQRRRLRGYRAGPPTDGAR